MTPTIQHPATFLRPRLDALRTEMADLAFELERQGRCDAADIVMMLDARVREIAGEAASDESAHLLSP